MDLQIEDRSARSEWSLLEGDDATQQCEIQGLITDGLKLGLNVHASIDTCQTQFSELSQNYWLKKRDLHVDFCERLLIWFKLLNEAGHDLQAYILKEQSMLLCPRTGSTIDDQRDFKVLTCKPELKGSKIYSFQRRMLLEKHKGLNDITLYVEEFDWSKGIKLALQEGGHHVGRI